MEQLVWKHGTWCIAHLELILGIKVIPLLDCLKINILLFEQFYFRIRRKIKQFIVKCYIGGQDSQLGSKFTTGYLFFFLVSAIRLLFNFHPQISKVFVTECTI